jgi:hypothetical protein
MAKIAKAIGVKKKKRTGYSKNRRGFHSSWQKPNFAH